MNRVVYSRRTFFQNQGTSGAAMAVAPGCEDRDFDDDNDADQSDFGIFQRCCVGPAGVADLACAD